MHENFNENFNFENETFMCKKCGCNQIDRSKSENSVLCTKCREEQIKYPIPKIFILVAIAIVVIMGFSLVNLPKQLKLFKLFSMSQENIDKGRVNGTLEELEEILEKNGDVDENVVVDIIKMAMESGKYEYTANIINKYLVGKEMLKFVYDDVIEYYDILEPYFVTYDSFYSIMEGIDNNASVEEIYEVVKSSLLALENDPSQYKALLYYYVGFNCLDLNEAIKYFDLSISYDDNFINSKVEKAKTLRKINDIEQSEQLSNNLLDIECDNYEIIRNLSIINMLKGNSKEAVKLAKEAYKLCKEDEYVYNTLIVALTVDGQADKAQKYIDDYVSKGNELDADILRLLNNEITLEDYYIG